MKRIHPFHSWTILAFFSLALLVPAVQQRLAAAAAPDLGAASAQESVEGSATVEKAMKQVYPALVRIDVVITEPSSGRMSKMRGAGSGAIISKDGYVITNHHVAGKAERLVCRLFNGDELEAKLVGTDPLADIAVLQLLPEGTKYAGKPFECAVFGDSSKVKVGDAVLAMGSPGGMTQTVTKGIVSNTTMMLPAAFGGRMELDGEQTGSLVRWIGHDASIYGGNSGGPLVNLEGQIIGVNEVSIAGLGGAIPGDLAQSVANQLIKKGKPERSWIGVLCQPRLKSSKEDKGVLVAGILKDSPAGKGDLKPGDMIVKFDGTEVNARLPEDIPVFNRVVLSTPIGKTVEVAVLRDGKEKTLSLTTTAQEKARGDDEELRSWGMTAENLTRMTALALKRPDKNGVLVTSLRPGGPVSEAKPPLDGGDIITEVDGKPMQNMAALQQFTADATKNKEERVPVLVRFERGLRSFLTVVKVGKEPEKDKPKWARKAWLSADTQVLTSDLAKALKLEGESGERITRIYPGRGAEKAGLKVGDVLLKLDGNAIEASRPEDTEVLSTMIRQYKIGTKATFDVVRDGKRIKVDVTLEDPPTPVSDMKRYVDDDFELTVREMTLDDRLDKELKEEEKGVLVERIEPSGWASLAGVGGGDVVLSIDGQPVPDAAGAEKALKAARERHAKQVVFFVKRGIGTMYLELEPMWDKKDEAKKDEARK